MHLAQFWSIIPEEVRREMTQWKCMSMPLEEAVKIRKNIRSIDINLYTGKQ